MLFKNLNFEISNFSGVFLLFLLDKYLETPGERLFSFLRHSVHSRVIVIRGPLFFAIVEKDKKGEKEKTVSFSLKIL